MNVKSFLIGAVALSLAAVVYAQTSQTSQSTSQSKSGNGQATSSYSARSSANGWSSSSGSRNSHAGGTHFGAGSGNGSSVGIHGKPTHAIFYTLNSGNSNDANDQMVFDQHTKYMSDHQTKGKVLLFGPWRDLPGSMAIVLAKSDEEANEIAKNDPAVKSGALTFEVRAWNVMALSAENRTPKPNTRIRN